MLLLYIVHLNLVSVGYWLPLRTVLHGIIVYNTPKSCICTASLWLQCYIVLSCTVHLNFVSVGYCLPLSVPHAHIRYIGQPYRGRYPRTDIARAICDNHFVKEGPEEIHCLEKEEWSGSFECRGNYIEILYYVLLVLKNWEFLILVCQKISAT